MLLRIVKLSANAKIPIKGSSSAAGYDLYSAYDYNVPPMGKVLAKTDIQIHVWRSIAQMLLRHKTSKQTNQIHVSSGYYGRVTPCSGLAAKHFIDIGAGVIDEDYRGNLCVVVFNFGKESFKACNGDRIAQLICERIYPEIVEAEKLDDTDRGGGGFGSTGKTAFSKT